MISRYDYLARLERALADFTVSDKSARACSAFALEAAPLVGPVLDAMGSEIDRLRARLSIAENVAYGMHLLSAGESGTVLSLIEEMCRLSSLVAALWRGGEELLAQADRRERFLASKSAVFERHAPTFARLAADERFEAGNGWTFTVQPSPSLSRAVSRPVVVKEQEADMNEASIIRHDDGPYPWLEVRWQGRTEEVFHASEAQDAAAYAVALQANGGPLFDEDVS